MLFGWLMLVDSGRRYGCEIKMWFTTTGGGTVGVWFGKEERSELEGEAEPLYVPALLSVCYEIFLSL